MQITLISKLHCMYTLSAYFLQMKLADGCRYTSIVNIKPIIKNVSKLKANAVLLLFVRFEYIMSCTGHPREGLSILKSTSDMSFQSTALF